MSAVYDQARYYEIAFSFVDVPRHVDLLETFIRELSRTPVRAVLDVCCGPGRQAREFAGIVEMQGAFECLGFFEREQFAPLAKISSDNYVALRKR